MCNNLNSKVNYCVDVRLQTLQCGSAHWGPLDKSFFCIHSLPYLHGLCYMYIYNLITQHLWIMVEHSTRIIEPERKFLICNSLHVAEVKLCSRVSHSKALPSIREIADELRPWHKINVLADFRPSCARKIASCATGIA